VLDEPTSALDPTAAEDVLAAVTRLVHDLGVTVVMAEHRLERVAQYADLVALVAGDGTVSVGPPAEQLARAAVAPPIVELGRLAGWDPLPLSVRDARRLAGPLRDRLASVDPRSVSTLPATVRQSAHPALTASGVTVRYGAVAAVRGVDLSIRPGEVVALMGRNGSGKSSLLWALQGSGRRSAGRVDVAGRDPHAVGTGEARRLVGLVPQTPSDLLYLPTVEEECTQADRDAGAPAGTCRDLLHRLVGDLDGSAHPHDLSEGQRLGLVLAVQLTASPAVVLLDEPTRGLDYRAKERFGREVRRLAGDAAALVISTHDVEFVATVADRVVVLADGEVVADGPTDEVVVASPAFAPQVSKVLAPQRWLHVGEVAAALRATPAVDA
jgi:energy-coupling factor transport system ATP-binding protein